MYEVTETHSVRSTAELIKQMEVDLGLLDDATYGEFARLVWESYRFQAHTLLKSKLLEHGTAHTPVERYYQMSPLRRMKWYVQTFINAVFRGWIVAPKGRKWLIIQHSRSRKRPEGTYEDIYTHDFVSLIPEHDRVVIENPYHWRHENPRSHKAWYGESSMLVSFIVTPFAKAKYRRIKGSVEKMAADIDSYLQACLCTSFDIGSIISTEAWRVKKSLYTSSFMLRWLRPENVLLVCSYGHEASVSSARKLNIPTIEVQHGVVTPEHLGYAVHAGTNKAAFPDYLLLFGEYWKQTVTWPLEPKRLTTVGFPYFERTKRAVADTQKTQSAVVISQGTIGRKLSLFAVALAEELQNTSADSPELIYKLHPGEWARWRTEYPELVKAADSGSIQVIDGGTPDLYQLLAAARWQIGVNSTAIFEGLGLGCITYLFDLSGIVYMEPLIKAGYARVVTKPTDISWDEEIEHIRQPDQEQFFASDWEGRFRTFLEQPLECRSE